MLIKIQVHTHEGFVWIDHNDISTITPTDSSGTVGAKGPILYLKSDVKAEFELTEDPEALVERINQLDVNQMIGDIFRKTRGAEEVVRELDTTFIGYGEYNFYDGVGNLTVERVDMSLIKGQKLSAVKEFKVHTGWGLKEAKEWCDRRQEYLRNNGIDKVGERSYK